MRSQLLLIRGSVRAGSTNAAALRTAGSLAPDGVTVSSYDELAMLPHFNPDDDGDRLPAVVADLRARLATADAVLLSTPEYAGALPGAFKNLLDGSVGGGELSRKPVGWINSSWALTGAHGGGAGRPRRGQLTEVSRGAGHPAGPASGSAARAAATQSSRPATSMPCGGRSR